MRALKTLALILSLLISRVDIAFSQIRLAPESVPALADVADGSWFGYDLAVLDDLDGNGTPDLLVGVPRDSEAGTNAGAVWILFMKADGSVVDARKYSATNVNLPGPPNEQFLGSRVNALGDFRNKGVYEITIASPALGQFLRLNAAADVVSVEQLPRFDSPEASVVVIGDIDENGALDLAETRQNSRAGAVEIIPYFSAGGANLHAGVSISEFDGGWPDVLDPNDDFGWDVTNIGDLDGDGRDELVAGAPGDDDYFQEAGAVYVFFLRASGEVQRFQKISATEGGLQGKLSGGDRFGTVVASLGDLDEDGLDELAVGAPGDGAGSIWVLFLNPDGTVQHESKIRLIDYGVPVEDVPAGNFEHGISLAPDFGGDGIPDLAVGLPNEGIGGSVWFLPALPDLASHARFFEVGPDASNVGADIPIHVQAFGVGGVSGVRINLRWGGELSFLSGEMNPDGDFFSYDIPARLGDSQGLEYYVTITNAAGKNSRQPQEGYVSVPLMVPDGILLPVSQGSSTDGYRIVSIPLEYDHVSLLDVLESSLGTRDKSKWRAFLMSNGVVVEATDRATLLEPGLAFWLLSREHGRVLQPGPGQTLRTDHPLEVRLLKEWNLVGNPFDFPIPLSSLRTRSGQPIDLRSYDGDWNFVEDALQPKEGYAVFSARDDTLIFAPQVRGATSKRQNFIDESAIDWSVEVRATDTKARDNHNTFGTSPIASKGWDLHDRAEPPAIGDYVSVYFRTAHPDSPMTRLQNDFRPSIDKLETWNLEVVSARQRTVTLEFAGGAAAPDGLHFVLFDPVLERYQNLKEDATYSLVGGAPNHPRELVVTVGRSLWSAVSTEVPAVDVLEAFPNPFSGAATLRFSLRSPSRTSIRVYDVAGRVVSVLTDSEYLGAGVHTAIWDGRDAKSRSVASGLYFVRVETGATARSVALSVAR